MKKGNVLTVLAFAVLLFAACGNSEANRESVDTTQEMPVVESNEKMTSAQLAETGIDPVCHMTNDGTWTFASVVGDHTIHFCSETCKTAFDGNQNKYLLIE